MSEAKLIEELLKRPELIRNLYNIYYVKPRRVLDENHNCILYDIKMRKLNIKPSKGFTFVSYETKNTAYSLAQNYNLESYNELINNGY